MNHPTERPPQEKVCGYEYTVRRGDSFYLIANRLGVPLRDLLEANSDINPARLMVGDVLCIPLEEDDSPPVEEEQPPEAPAEPETPPEEAPPEEALPGDEDLDAPAVDEEMAVCPEANRYTVREGETVTDIQLRANVNRYTLQNANPSVQLDTLQTGQVLCVPGENIACPGHQTCILRTGETLESVALRLNTSLSALLRTNPCLAPSDFTAGRCISVP